jgi:hypothetical protein
MAQITLCHSHPNAANQPKNRLFILVFYMDVREFVLPVVLKVQGHDQAVEHGNDWHVRILSENQAIFHAFPFCGEAASKNCPPPGT